MLVAAGRGSGGGGVGEEVVVGFGGFGGGSVGDHGEDSLFLIGAVEEGA